MSMFHTFTRQDGIKFFIENSHIEFITATPKVVKLYMKSGRTLKFFIDDDEEVKRGMTSILKHWLPINDNTTSGELWKIPKEESVNA